MGGSHSYLDASAPLKVASSPVYGKYLTDNAGRALYIFTRDSTDTSVCSGDCLIKWPIYAPVNQQITGTPDISAALLGKVSTSNQLTYNRWPLYYYYLDAAPNDTNGQTINAEWYLVRPDGHPIVTHHVASTADSQPTNDLESLSSDWKKDVSQQSFAEYYRWKKWRNYADTHDHDWNDKKAFQRWNSDYWHPNYDKIYDSYRDWQNDYNPHHRYDWQSWQDWSN